ncbi:MAG: type I phosphomannose isomerase catalytic subunit [Chthoniobacterales bacterium]
MNKRDFLPIVFEPVFMERVWGGRRLESLYGKKLPRGVPVGESWEVVDREEAQSVVRAGPLRGRTLHDLWTEYRDEIFGDVSDAPRFPLLIKLLDAHDTLSLQVHPPERVAVELGGEPKTEFWYIADAMKTAELFVGLTRSLSPEIFAQAIAEGNVEELAHRFPVKTGDAMFLPSGRLHAIGAGNLIVEVQQNGDTTYRVSDWNRSDSEGGSRKLHVAESLRCIDFGDVRPQLTRPHGESLVSHELFNVDKWQLRSPREAAEDKKFAIVCCLTGALTCAGVTLRPGEFFLVPAALQDRAVGPAARDTSLLRITIGAS